MVTQFLKRLDFREEIKMGVRRDFEADLERSFKGMTPLIVKACEPIANSLHEIKERYGINVSSAELEVNLSYLASGAAYLSESKQESSVTIKLLLSPDSTDRHGLNSTDFR